MTTDKNVAVENVRSDGAKRQPQSGGIGSLLSLRRGIDQLFDDMFRGVFGTPTRRFFDLDPFRGGGAWPAAGVTVPSINVAESPDSFTITAEMPGLDEKDIDVSVADDVLTLKGARREDKRTKEKGLSRGRAALRRLPPRLSPARGRGRRENFGLVR